MNDTSSQKPILINNLSVSKAEITHVIHFTGGLVAIPVVGGQHVLGPVQADSGGLNFLGPMLVNDAFAFARLVGCYFVGVNEINGASVERCAFWKPNLVESRTPTD